MIKKRPRILGEVNIPKEDRQLKAVQKQMKRTMQQMARSRKMWQERKFKLMLARHRRENAIRDHRNAVRNLKRIKPRFFTRYNHYEYLADAIKRREYAVERVKKGERRFQDLERHRRLQFYRLLRNVRRNRKLAKELKRRRGRVLGHTRFK